MADRRTEGERPLTGLGSAASGIPGGIDREAVSAASVLQGLQRVDALAKSGELHGTPLVTARAQLIIQSLFLPPAQRNGVGIVVVGRGRLDEAGKLLTGGFAPHTTEVDVQFPSSGETTPTNVIALLDGELYGPHDRRDVRRRQISELVDTSRSAFPHEQANWLAIGMRVITDQMFELRGGDHQATRGLSYDRSALMDGYLRTALEAERLHEELRPLFFFERDPKDRERMRLYMRIYGEPNIDERRLDPTIEPAFGDVQRVISFGFTRSNFEMALVKDKRIQSDGPPEYSLTNLMEDAERTQALAVYKRHRDPVLLQPARRRARRPEGTAPGSRPASAGGRPAPAGDERVTGLAAVAQASRRPGQLVQRGTEPVAATAEIAAAEPFLTAQPEIQVFPDVALRVRNALELSAEERAAEGETSFIVVRPEGEVRTDSFSTYPVIMRVGSDTDQVEYVTSRQELARVDQRDSRQVPTEAELRHIDELIQTNATEQVEDVRDTYNRLLAEMQTIPQHAQHAAAFVTRLNSAINSAASFERPCVYEPANRGTHTDYIFEFRPIPQSGPDQRSAPRPEPVRIVIRRDWLEASAKSYEGDEQTAARTIYKRIGQGNFRSPVEEI